MAQKQNFAFISYNHADVKQARWLQNKLEAYKLPTQVMNEIDRNNRYIRPVFRDQTDLNTGVLGEVLREQLENSHWLIVLCSPNSAKSQWVSREVQSFVQWDRVDRIIPVIIEGQPNCYDPDLECFPAYLRKYTKEHPEKELLGVSYAEVGREKAFIRIVSKMLDVSFDSLWKRHERERRRRIAIASISTPIILALLYWFILPMSITVNLKDADHQLPISQNDEGYVGTVTINGTDYFVNNLDTTITIGSIPGYYRGSSVDVSFSAAYYYDSLKIDVPMGIGLGTEADIQLKRDDSFRYLAGTILDFESGSPVEGAVVSIDDGKYSVTTDADGHFSIDIAIEDQREVKDVSIAKDGYREELLEEETVDSSVTYMLHRP